MPIKIDRFKIDYFEVQVETFCAICKTTFLEFPDSDKFVYSCPQCHRSYKVGIEIKPVDEKALIKRFIKKNLTETDMPEIM